MGLLGVNEQSHIVVQEGVRPWVIPNSSFVAYILFEMRKNNARVL
uniref:Uncharacterized protein n=1 Tax=Arundo donax TaxID=35708 RepID=A0A0A8Z1N5_ARUDO